MGTLRAALQLLIPKAFGVGVVPLLEQALAFPEGLLGLSPFGGFGGAPIRPRDLFPRCSELRMWASD